jgi:uncharacterized protein YecE (DUF72 family)
MSVTSSRVATQQGLIDADRRFGTFRDGGRYSGRSDGCFLFQLPPRHRYTKPRLDASVSQLDPARRNVVEFRYASPWNEEVYRAFQEAGVRLGTLRLSQAFSGVGRAFHDQQITLDGY